MTFRLPPHHPHRGAVRLRVRAEQRALDAVEARIERLCLAALALERRARPRVVVVRDDRERGVAFARLRVVVVCAQRVRVRELAVARQERLEMPRRDEVVRVRDAMLAEGALEERDEAFDLAAMAFAQRDAMRRDARRERRARRVQLGGERAQGVALARQRPGVALRLGREARGRDGRGGGREIDASRGGGGVAEKAAANDDWTNVGDDDARRPVIARRTSTRASSSSTAADFSASSAAAASSSSDAAPSPDDARDAI